MMKTLKKSSLELNDIPSKSNISDHLHYSLPLEIPI